jgi:RHS repeat-associated protein
VAINRYDTATFTGGTVYLGKDALGSVRGATNDYGLLEERYEYDAFEKPYKGDLNSGMNLGYTGKPYDTATGMYNYGYRDYQPEVARFTTVDPIRDGANWFAYVNNDPVNWVDLWGLEIIYLKGPGATDADTEATKQMEENVKNSGTLAGQLVQKLADSDKTVRVEVNTERINEAWPGNDGNMTWDEAVKSADGTGGDVYIRFDPTDNTPLDDGTKGYAEATYVHEVAGHGYPMATGTNPPDQKTREVDATAIENQYRASQGWEQRKTYGSWDVPQYENQPVTLARNRHKGKR